MQGPIELPPLDGIRRGKDFFKGWRKVGLRRGGMRWSRRGGGGSPTGERFEHGLGHCPLRGHSPDVRGYQREHLLRLYR